MSHVCPEPSCGGTAFNSELALRSHTLRAHPSSDTQHGFETTFQDGFMTVTTTSSFDDFNRDLSRSDSSFLSTSNCDFTVWQCTICNSEFDSRWDLKEHAKSCLEADLLYQCSDCKEQFKYLSALYDHVDETKCNHVKSVAKSMANLVPLTNGSVYEASLYFDGAAIPNPGDGGAGYILIDAYGRTMDKLSINILVTECSKNEAAYCALLKGLQCAVKHNLKSLLVQSDSELIINQMTSHYAVEDEKLISLNRVAVRSCAGMFDILDFQWIPKRENSIADALAKQGCRRQGDSEQVTLIS